jgi:hypothetical protein
VVHFEKSFSRNFPSSVAPLEMDNIRKRRLAIATAAIGASATAALLWAVPSESQGGPAEWGLRVALVVTLVSVIVVMWTYER